MPRRPRIHLAGHPQRIVQRGHNRAACFFAEEDYRFSLHWLKLGAEKYGCDIHAYILTTNHVHLLLTPQRPEAVSRLMQSLGRRYAQYVNRFYRRSGAVWEGRFKAGLIQAEEYLLTCYRYIELNPVRADMVRDPGDYVWSGYRHNGLGGTDALITEHPSYRQIGASDKERQSAYRALFRAHLDEPALTAIREAVNRGQPLGAERFQEQVEVALGRRVGLRGQGRKAETTDAPLPGQLGLNL